MTTQDELNEMLPFIASQSPKKKQSSSLNVDIGVSDNDPSNDPLLSQLPQALLKYISYPKEHHDDISFVKRDYIYAIYHWIMSALCSLLCFYSFFKMVVVKKGEIALTQYGDEPEILAQGRHVLLSPFNRCIGVYRETEQVITHGPIHIIKVQSGQLGYGNDMKTGHPVLLTQGMHIINSTTFKWERFITLKEKKTKLGQLIIIRVETGYVGYCYKQGELVILKPGLHLIQPPDRFGDLITTQMTILDLPFATHETSDYVPLGIKAAVFYRIVDPLKALVRIQDIPKQIEETSVATLAGIIRGSSLSDVASRSTPFYHPKQKNKLKRKYMKNKKEEKQDNDINDQLIMPSVSIPIQPSVNMIDCTSVGTSSYAPSTPSAPPYFQHVHDEFMQQLHDHVADEWGIEIQNIRIESLKIADQKLQSNISSQAIKVSNVHNEYMLLMKQQEIATVKAETTARKMKIDTDAEAQQIKIRAQAKADAIIIEAKAKKQAKQLQGQGESEYARLLESTKLGISLASMKIQSDALNGLDQIAYVPHLPSMLKSQIGIYADPGLLLPNAKINKK